MNKNINSSTTTELLAADSRQLQPSRLVHIEATWSLSYNVPSHSSFSAWRSWDILVRLQKSKCFPSVWFRLDLRVIFEWRHLCLSLCFTPDSLKLQNSWVGLILDLPYQKSSECFWTFTLTPSCLWLSFHWRPEPPTEMSFFQLWNNISGIFSPISRHFKNLSIEFERELKLCPFIPLGLTDDSLMSFHLSSNPGFRWSGSGLTVKLRCYI